MLCRNALLIGAAVLAGLPGACGEPARRKMSAAGMQANRITDRSGGSVAAGPTAVKWGFMCNIAARRGDRLYAVNFIRPPGAPDDSREPNEMPIAFWASEGNGAWRSVYLDPPTRTYQTPSLLLGPDGRANVFSLKPGDGTIYWFRGETPENSAFQMRSLPMNWGAYLGGAIDEKGRALMVYWADYHPEEGLKDFDAMESGYRKSTLGYTLVDTVSGKYQNGLIDSPGAPYCYSQVAFDHNGAHVFTVRSEVARTLVCNSRNHYVDLRYYYTPDPAKKAAWKCIPIYSNPRASIQPLGIEIDRAGRVHLLYYFIQEIEGGKISPLSLMYAISKQPVNAKKPPEFVQREIKSGWDGRLFQTSDGRIGVLSYQAGTNAEWTEVLDGVAGKFTPWTKCEMPVQQCRLFPVSRRGGSTLTRAVEGVFVGMPTSKEERSLYHFQWEPPRATLAGK